MYELVRVGHDELVGGQWFDIRRLSRADKI